MRRCLRDQTLLLLYEGEGTDVERAHLKACWFCAKRYHRLGRDLEVIGRALREEPPVRSFDHRSRPFYARWVPVAATSVAVVIALSLGGMWAWRSAPPPFPEKSRSEDVLHFLGEVSTAVFVGANHNVVETSSSRFTFAHLSEALGEE